MSLFGGTMGDFDDDAFLGHHMRSMRQMNNMMNSLFADPFGMMGGFGMGAPALTMGGLGGHHNSLMPFGFPAMPQMGINRLLSGSLDSGLADSHSFSSSSMVSLSMSSGPDGRPQVVQASSSTRTGPGGIRETKRTLSDSRSGTKKMAIGHHIGDRAHVIEREQNLHSGDQEERQEYINIEEEEAEDFNREFENRARSYRRHGGHPQLALPSSAGPSNSWRSRTARVPSASATRRALRTPPHTPLALPASTCSMLSRHPYATSHPASRRPIRPMKSVSGHSSGHDRQQSSSTTTTAEQQQQEEEEPTLVIEDEDTDDETRPLPQQHQSKSQKYPPYGDYQ